MRLTQTRSHIQHFSSTQQTSPTSNSLNLQAARDTFTPHFSGHDINSIASGIGSAITWGSYDLAAAEIAKYDPRALSLALNKLIDETPKTETLRGLIGLLLPQPTVGLLEEPRPVTDGDIQWITPRLQLIPPELRVQLIQKLLQIPDQRVKYDLFLAIRDLGDIYDRNEPGSPAQVEISALRDLITYDCAKTGEGWLLNHVIWALADYPQILQGDPKREEIIQFLRNHPDDEHTRALAQETFPN